jgi:hypothetical protein
VTTQPEALRLADWLETWNTIQHDKAADELRRQHALNGELLEALKQITATKNLAKELEAEWCPAATSMVWVARAAIARAEGKV